MGDREKQLAAILFIATALLFPILPRGEQSPEKKSEMAPFLLRSALLELRLDAASRSLAGARGDDPAEGTGDEAEDAPFTLFAPEPWLEVADDLPAKEKCRFLAQLTGATLAVGRDKAAAALREGCPKPPEENAPLVYFLSAAPQVPGDLLTRDLQASRLPDWVGRLLLDRYAVAEAPPLAEEKVQEALGPWLASVSSFFFVMTLLFFAGLVLLVMAPRLLARYKVQLNVVSNGMFGAPPLYTFLLFAGWFALTTTLSMLVAPLLSQEFSRASVILVIYLITAGLGLWLIRSRSLMRTDSLAVAVDLDRASLTLRNLGLGLAGYVVAVPVIFALSLLSALLLGGGEDGLNPAIPVLVDARGSADYWLLVVNVAVLAPLFEEFFFRGFLFQQFRRFYSTANAVLLSALVFASVHLSIESFLPLFGLGIILAGVYHYTRSLWAAMLTHALWNLGTVFAVTVLFG